MRLIFIDISGNDLSLTIPKIVATHNQEIILCINWDMMSSKFRNAAFGLSLPQYASDIG